MAAATVDFGLRAELLFAFCRLQLPGVALASDVCRRHLHRTYDLFLGKSESPVTARAYLDGLYPVDWYLACACLENHARAWDALFASKAGRSDCLLLDALRARAVRLFPRDDERQDSAVGEFWAQLVVPEAPGRLATLARYDGQRPLVPWLIRVFQNWHVSQLRKQSHTQALPEEEFATPVALPSTGGDLRWREAFAHAAHEWLDGIDDAAVVLLGLRLRYRLSQREVASLLKVHEGTISRRTDQVRDECLGFLQERMIRDGWTGDDLSDLIRAEMPTLLLDAPRLSVDSLAQLLARQGKKLPA